MNRSILATAMLAVFLGSTAFARARPPEQRREEQRDARPESKYDRRERTDGRHHRPGASAGPSVAEAPPAAPSVAVAPPANGVAPTAQLNAARFRDHFMQTQQLARQRRKQSSGNAKAWNDSRPQRADSHRSDVAQTYGNIADQPDARAELALHADRMARLNRLLDLAEEKGDTNLINQTNDLINREVTRDANVMANIQSKAGTP